MTLVVDASVAAKWFLIEPGDREAMALLDGPERLIAPELIVAEVVNVVWKRLLAGTIDRSQAADVPGQLPELFAELCSLAPARRTRAGDRRPAAPSGLRLLLPRAGRGQGRPAGDRRSPVREPPHGHALGAARHHALELRRPTLRRQPPVRARSATRA